MARRFPHLRDIANQIPQIDENAEIHLLIGRDAPELLKVRDFRNGPRGAPWAQKISLGWTIIGQMCLDLCRGARSRACLPHQPPRSRLDGEVDGDKRLPIPAMS
ncbi:hypothetical protein P5673_029955 [Acropora cervicornis]|uniref:Uncharacterized protein n=1 Tax=Acropora cervicornis TaxID=6130 RepID=A0AAD9PVB7_ACRCE|nr:hypothetical protein P5673_029955 [Acropora cervicornis]